jgi:hypothetical protein
VTSLWAGSLASTSAPTIWIISRIPRDASLIEGMDVEPAANEIGGDVCLKIGERQDKIGRQREDLVNIRRGEGAYAWLLAASLRRAQDIAGDPDDAVLLAEQIQRPNRLFGQADIRLGGRRRCRAVTASMVEELGASSHRSRERRVEVAERARRLRPDLPILLVTGYAEPDGLRS